MNTLTAEICENGIHYTLHGDYYFPDLGLPKNNSEFLGKYGLLRLAHLQEYRPDLYTRLILSGNLYDHLTEIDKTAHERLNAMIPRMAAAEGITESLKAVDPLIWTAGMNSIRHRAEESILDELIYT